MYNDENNGYEDETSSVPEGSHEPADSENESPSESLNAAIMNFIKMFLKANPWILVTVIGFGIFFMMFFFAITGSEKEYIGNASALKNCQVVEVTGNNSGFYKMDEYVAGVMEAMIGNNYVGMETLKALSIVIRTNTINNTWKYTPFEEDLECGEAIENNSDQPFVPPTNSNIIFAANDTNNEVIGDPDSQEGKGEFLEVHYSTYPGEEKSKAFMPSCSLPECEGGECRVEIFRSPYDSSSGFELQLPSDITWNGNSLENQSGYCYGFSLVGANYIESNYTMDYKRLIEYFFFDGRLGSPSYGGPIIPIDIDLSFTDTTGIAPLTTTLVQHLESQGTNIPSFNAYLSEQVGKNGMGTRNGVLAAAMVATVGLGQYGAKIPYFIGGGWYNIHNPDSNFVENSSYGVNGTWGTYKGDGYRGMYFGLDCVGFVVWALHNGGFSSFNGCYDGSHCGNLGTTIGATVARPGDLLVNSGHVILIVGATDSGYWVTQASPNGGVKMNMLPFSWFSSDSEGITYHGIDMSEYYGD